MEFTIWVHPSIYTYYCIIVYWRQLDHGEAPPTCMKTFILSRGAVPVRDTAPAIAPADSCFHQMPVVFSSSVNSSGMVRLSPISRTYSGTQWNRMGWQKQPLEHQVTNMDAIIALLLCKIFSWSVFLQTLKCSQELEWFVWWLASVTHSNVSMETRY